MKKFFLYKYLPTQKTIRSNKLLRFLGATLLKDRLWYFTRYSTSIAFFVGIFWAFIPMPFQMIPAAICAIIFNCNLPLSIALVWLTNPFTMPAIWYVTYRLGCYILDIQHISITSIDFNNLATTLNLIWKPLYLGSIICGIFFGALASSLTPMVWRFCTYLKWSRRRKQKTTK